MNAIRVQDLLSKRIFGYLRWKLHRGAEHSPGVLTALQADLASIKPDHIAVTGDLTHLSLPAEYIKAAQWLQSLGSPDQVTVIPGNHDAYVKTNWRQGWSRWTEYMLGDNAVEHDHAVRHPDSLFPSLRFRGPVALIGVCTAQPCAPHLAIGTVGPGQLQKLEPILAQTSRQQLYRVVLVHHPPAPGTVSWRKRLTDAAALRSLISRYGAELILHGHAHRVLQNHLPTPTGRVPVMGAPSASALGRKPERRARYYIYRITPGADSWNVDLTVRIYSPDNECFITESEQRISYRQ
ncbi:MAG: metallophosphoesterase [Desulfobacterales bacterium]|nr:MAG: metallophosphoesterase [Desulfobacterales bacterium]